MYKTNKLTKLIAVLMDIPVSDILASRVLREINLGLFVGEDKNGSLYRALVAFGRSGKSISTIQEMAEELD